MNKIKTTHVGSLPRSNELSELLFKKDKKEKIDLIKFDEVVKKDVEKIVKKQIELGIDIISDGEMSKISYATYVKDRLDGFSGESERKVPKDLDDFPSFINALVATPPLLPDNIGVQAQIVTVVDDERYYFPNFIRGMITNKGLGYGQHITAVSDI